MDTGQGDASKSETNGDITAATANNAPVKSVKPPAYKIIILGESGVGKTCLSFRFCAGRFPHSTEATIGLDFREKIVELEGSRIKLQLWDTAGQERFRKSVTPHYYRGASAVVLVYDVTNPGSLLALDHWIDELHHHGLGPKIPRILVGNKCDHAESEVKVKTEDAQRWADDRGMPLFETSAKDDSQCDHVEAIFLTVAHKLKNGKNLIKPVVDPNNPEIEPVRILYRSSLTQQSSTQEEQSSCCF
eukprot:TRINITY_DN9741_c0_g1_i1.p1 TRINITY_DN9741_c0_g1~~TRINITY_DN9741_c0_g1_i1.p1  ORF type:complete len:246 (+),score=34.12 TRINITY_DN9741_c0_g1_i1:34-771(+)